MLIAAGAPEGDPGAARPLIHPDHDGPLWHLLPSADTALAAALDATQEEFRVTAKQLKVNQRISQAAVRRANEALTRLDALPSLAAAAPAPQPTQPEPPKPAPLTNDVVIVASDTEVVPPGEVGAAEIPCSGQLSSGSVGYTLPETAVGLVYEFRPRPGGGWRVAFRNDGTEPVALALAAVCIP